MSHPMDMVRVCPTCLEASRTYQNTITQLRTCGCLEPQVHEEHDSGNENWLLTVTNERSGCLEIVRPVPNITLSGKFIMCRNTSRGRVCQYNWCTYAHTRLELRAWNRALKIKAGFNSRNSSYLRRVSVPLPRSPPNRFTATFRHQFNYQLPPLTQLNQCLLEAPLTYDNYQDKFHMLLYYEEHEHQKELKERCDGVYTVNIYLHVTAGTIHGTIEGLVSTKVAYVRQEADGVQLILPTPTVHSQQCTSPIVAQFTKQTYEQTDNIVYFEFVDRHQIQMVTQYCPYLLQNPTSLQCPVQFIVKHHYFASLHYSLENLQPHVISKLVPRSTDLNLSLNQIRYLPKPDIKILSLDQEYQLLALKKLVGCSSNAIFLITGPFGTGKTRLLATAAYNFLKSPNSRSRVLICTCHVQSADAYINDYFGPMVDQEILSANTLLRLVAKNNPTNHVKHYYSWCVSNSMDTNPVILNQKTLVVTTFMSTQQLLKLRVTPYTHILIDEGAQGREPEAVAPLSLADKHTKIVVAGDHMQVGPQVSVLGKEAQKHGLATSLLQRMHIHYNDNAQSTKHLTSILLTNYRCHDTILRLPSMLFFESTLQARSIAELHPSCTSALEFVCTSLDQNRLYNCPDFDDMEAVILLEQVKHYLSDWPVAEWGTQDYSKICIMSPSTTQISKIYQHLKDPAFSFLSRVAVLKSYALQGREFRAVFISALEATTQSGAARNPTTSICNQYVFNTIITRAQSLVVCVGNPFLLLSIESHTDQKQCWKEYLKRCLEVSSFKISPQCRAAFADTQSIIHNLYLKVFGDLQSFLASPHRKVDDSAGDTILERYTAMFQSLPQCRRSKVILGRIANGDRGYKIQEDKGDLPEEDKEIETYFNDHKHVECYLHCESYRLSWAIPINPNQDPIKIQGIDNRRQAFDGARVHVNLYRDIERSGCVTKVVKQGPEWQFICTMDAYNSIMFNPIDQKNPRFVNLPGLSRDLLLNAGNIKTIKKELEIKQHSVTVFDPTSFTNPYRRSDEEENQDLEIPKIKDVIPQSIARRLLFVVWYLGWEKTKRYPLGVVVAALPKGLTSFHAERLLCTQYSISAPDIEITPGMEAELSAASSVGNVSDEFNGAIIIEQHDIAFTLQSAKVVNGRATHVLGVHFVNVARLLPEGKAIDQLACHRGTSLCNVGPNSKHHPMLPSSAVQKWSFCSGKSHSCISASAEIHMVDERPTLCYNSTKIDESSVSPTAILSLREIQQILEKQFSEECKNSKESTKESKIGLLYLIAKHLCCARLQCDIPVLGASGNKEFSYAQFLVNELLTWMNRTVAEYMLSKNSSFHCILHKQRKPNHSQLHRVIEKHVAVLHFHPLLKKLQQKLVQPTVRTPFALEQGCLEKLHEALVQEKFTRANEVLLSVFQNQPQITVTCKELSFTEPNHEFTCSAMLQKLSPLKLQPPNKYLISVQDEKVSPYAHHGLHCLSSHITSPLQSYLDIIAQRLLVNALNDTVLFECPPEEIIRDCQIKQDNATHCEQSINQLNLVLSLAECAQPFFVYVGTVKETFPDKQSDKNTIQKGRLQFVFPDPALQWLEGIQCSIALSSITCGNLKQLIQNDSIVSTYNVKMTSFLHSSSTDFYHKGSCHIYKGDSAAVNDDKIKRMVFIAPHGSSSNDATLVKKSYTVKTIDSTVSIQAEDWKSVEEFLKSPSQTTGMQLLRILDKFPTEGVSKTTIIEDSSEFTSVIKDSSLWLYSGQFSIEPYKVFKIWLGASYARPLLMPTIQLLEVAPFLNICIQHNSTPASCFASPVLSIASKIKYNNMDEYVSLWEDVLLAEASVQSIKGAEMKIIHDVQLQWPPLKQPEASLDDVYFVPDGNIVIHPTKEFLEMSKDIFGFDIGDLVCVRYKVPLFSKQFKDNCTNYGLKDDKGYAVFHLVVYDVDITGVHLKFASPQNTRVSSFMKIFLEANPCCEMQLIPLNVSHRRVYKSLRSLLSLRYINRNITFRIALGRIIARGENEVDKNAVTEFKRQHNNNKPILELWPQSHVRRSLNDSQLYSISLAMKNDFQLIQGPPGTGKSVTGAHLAYAFYCKNKSIERAINAVNDKKIKCVLVCGPSNKSVDVVLDLLLQLQLDNTELRLLRIYGNSIERKDYMGPYYNKDVFTEIITDQVCKEDHRPHALHWLIRSTTCSMHRKVKEMDEKFKRLANENKIPSGSSIDEYRKIIKAAEDKVIQHGYDIVLCTCNEANSSRVTRNIAPVQVIIDEAAMATEPESMAAIKLASEHVTLIGDHMQLQPVIEYRPAADFGLGTSLFERYASPPRKKPGPATTEKRHFLRLDTQYRMHGKICEIPSKIFYDGELKTDYTFTRDCRIERFWPQGPDHPLAFCDVVGQEGGATSGNKKSSLFSKSNTTEAAKVAQIVSVLHNAKRIPKDKIAVLTPYSSQKDVILHHLSMQGLPGITVQTVTESQGREFGFVILSTVRSQPLHTIRNKRAVQPDRKWLLDHLGFVTDKHQICVALTRAKHGLIIVGNKTLLEYDETWQKLIANYYINGYIKYDRDFPPMN